MRWSLIFYEPIKNIVQTDTFLLFNREKLDRHEIFWRFFADNSGSVQISPGEKLILSMNIVNLIFQNKMTDE